MFSAFDPPSYEDEAHDYRMRDHDLWLEDLELAQRDRAAERTGHPTGDAGHSPSPAVVSVAEPSGDTVGSPSRSLGSVERRAA